MTREKLTNETPREDMMREALAHYEELATKACWHRSDIPNAIRAYYAPIPPAEGAEEILNKHTLAKILHQGHLINFEDAIAAMQEFATLHAQRIADKMVSERCKKCKYRGLPDSIQEALNSGDGVYRP